MVHNKVIPITLVLLLCALPSHGVINHRFLELRRGIDGGLECASKWSYFLF